MANKDKSPKNPFTIHFGKPRTRKQEVTEDLDLDNDYCPDSNYVTASEWAIMHPALLECGSDQYYADLANELADIIRKIKLSPTAPDNLAREIGIVLSAYLEDLVSDTKVFSAMRRVCLHRYAYRLPFYDCDHPDYMPDHINEEDIRFLIWATACRLGKDKEGMVYSPLAVGWELLARIMFDELNSRYEEAPEANRVALWMHRGFRKNDYIEIREMAAWLVLRNPLTCVRGLLDEIRYEARNIALERNLDVDRQGQLAYGMTATSAWQRSMSPMGCSSMTLVAALAAEFGFEACAADIANLEVLPMQFYALSEDKKSGKYFFETSSHDKIEVSRASLAKSLRPEEMQYAQCHLVKFRNKYLLNGLLFGDPVMKKKWEEQSSFLTYDDQRVQAEEFLEGLDGKQVLCMTRIKELFTQLGFTKGSILNEPRVKNIIVLISRELGVTVVPDKGYAFDIPDNRFYRPRRAAKESFSDIVFNNSLPHDIAVYIEKNHLLPQACIGASQGKEVGQRIVQDYLAFWIGFYRRLPAYGNAPNNFIKTFDKPKKPL